MLDKLNNLSLRQLRAMDEVATRGSFVEAARHLHLTPSALSETIKALERQLGLRLFDRSTRSVSLTQAGNAFLEHVRNSLQLLDHGVTHVAELRDLSAGHVRVMGATSALSCLVAPCVAGMWRESSRLKVELRTGLSQDMLAALREGRVDFCVASLPPGTGIDVDHIPLIEDRFGLVGRHDHPALQVDEVKLRDAGKFPYVSLNTRTSIDDTLASLSDVPAAFLEPSFIVDGTGSMAAILEQGVTLAILPALVLHQMRLPALRYVPLTAEFPVRRIELCRRAGRSLSPAAQMLWNAVLRQAQILGRVAGIRNLGPQT
ncbi:bacterial regulatory helix-turn-helix protein, LysR family protein 205 (plasmid) [Achromobacter xylosoxidans A8]|uniref:Bacterial regulatory helix-turn-helix protein, LysR family protein 205 n=1 Tax=Achromobacter xylosoxidans (strain A8) TaxID=762376 RepID=E3HY45_ACHXA|nr:LysR family transcriptional regulator [Achromobacter xylosoxidans]ADP19999.1 bacterial regulatory helix-turn-helix protein, LysR family protein 205 [Achromobacter xylosoxidans A8]